MSNLRANGWVDPGLRRDDIFRVLFLCFIFSLGIFSPVVSHAREMENFPIVKLQSLDKITARTITFEAKVGSTIKFGPLYIKIQSCQKAPPVEPPEAAAFLQIWQVTAEEKAEWVFSGWMFGSSPALSYMDHPIYDVWVLDCLERKSSEAPPPEQKAREGEGEVPEGQVPAQPSAEHAPEKKSEEPSSAEDGDLGMQ